MNIKVEDLVFLNIEGDSPSNGLPYQCASKPGIVCRIDNETKTCLVNWNFGDNGFLQATFFIRHLKKVLS